MEQRDGAASEPERVPFSIPRCLLQSAMHDVSWSDPSTALALRSILDATSEDPVRMEVAPAAIALADAEAAGRAEGPILEDRRVVLPCTVVLPTLDMMRARLERDGWRREASAIDGLSLYMITPPDFDHEFTVPLQDEATADNRWQARVEQALRTLAGLEPRENEDARDRPIGDLAAEIIATAGRQDAAASV